MSNQKKGFLRALLESFGFRKKTKGTKYVSPHESHPVEFDREMCVLELIDSRSKPRTEEPKECRLEAIGLEPKSKPYEPSFCMLEAIGLDDSMPTSTYVDDEPVSTLEIGSSKKAKAPKDPRRKR